MHLSDNIKRTMHTAGEMKYIHFIKWTEEEVEEEDEEKTHGWNDDFFFY